MRTIAGSPSMLATVTSGIVSQARSRVLAASTALDGMPGAAGLATGRTGGTNPCDGDPTTCTSRSGTWRRAASALAQSRAAYDGGESSMPTTTGVTVVVIVASVYRPGPARPWSGGPA